MNLKQTELLAMLRKQPDAYGVSIYEELEKRLKSGADSMAAATSGAVAVDFVGTETTASALARDRLSLGRGLCVLALALVFPHPRARGSVPLLGRPYVDDARDIWCHGKSRELRGQFWVIRDQNRPFRSLPLIPQERKYSGRRW